MIWSFSLQTPCNTSSLPQYSFTAQRGKLLLKWHSWRHSSLYFAAVKSLEVACRWSINSLLWLKFWCTSITSTETCYSCRRNPACCLLNNWVAKETDLFLIHLSLDIRRKRLILTNAFFGFPEYLIALVEDIGIHRVISFIWHL